MIEKNTIYDYLLQILDVENIIANEELKKHTFTKLGGPCDFFITPKSISEVQNIVMYCKENNVPYTVIGHGANLIIRDKGIKGIVISLKNINNIIIKDDLIICEAGSSIIDVSKIAYENSLSGLEFACGIPGTVGGAIFMNAGAYGGEIKDVLESVLILNTNCDIIKRYSSDLDLDYRYSNIQNTNEIILEASFRLSKSSKDEIKSKMDELSIERSSKQPLEYPSCGSIFKRPKGHYAGVLIRDSGLQGYRIGGAEISKKHAGFIVNINDAKSDDYIKLIDKIKTRVKEMFNVDLETEVRIIGEE